MAAPIPQIFRRLRQCKLDQLATIEVEFNLPQEYLDRNSVAARAKDILDLLKQRPDTSWIDQMLRLLDQVQSGARDYLGNRLEHLGSFLVESEIVDDADPESAGTVKQLREKLKEGKGLEEPVLVKVRGTLFPAALLTAGWWERKQQGPGGLKINWKSDLQQWLFEGFDLWAPSWDVCWGAMDPKDESKSYYIAQLTEGDEADSLPVIFGPEKARRLNDEFHDGWGGFEAVIVGYLGHRKHFSGKLPENKKRDPQDYYLSIDDDSRRHKVTRLNASTGLYSGYLWKLLVPEEYLQREKMLRLEHVYFVWEHTNFVARDAVDYNLESLAHKEEIIGRRHPGSKLVLLQKSHAIVSPEVRPAWSIEQFYNFYLKKAKDI